MKDIKALIILVILTAVLYWGVEPFAHSQMSAHTTKADFAFSDLEQMPKNGDPTKGAELFSSFCIACHGLASQNMPAPFGSAAEAVEVYGVMPPDLSSAGLIYEENFLAHVIKATSHATMQITQTKEIQSPMPDYMAGDEARGVDAEVADIVAYLKSIAPQSLDDRAVFIDACARCHNVRYDKTEGMGGYKGGLETYMGAKVPDLSMIIRSRSVDYLHTFINEPEKLLPGTAMPRVGLTQQAQEQVVAYLEKVGDSKKQERESLGYKLIIYCLILAVFAFLWKGFIWRDAH